MTSSLNDDLFISIDVETSGPLPGEYSLLSIGACSLSEPPQTFYIELQPVNTNHRAEALSISGLSMERLAAEGLPPAEAMQRLADWLVEISPPGKKPIFVAFNAVFDWMFVNYYFHTYLGYNPFGHAALDIKSYFMGLAGVRWQQTSMRYLGPRYLNQPQLSHHALQDALDQGSIFKRMLEEAANFSRS